MNLLVDKIIKGDRNSNRKRLCCYFKKWLCILLVDGIKPGTLGFEHGFGHTELGERQHWTDDKQQPVKIHGGDGVNINDIGLIDPTRVGKGVMLDGSLVRLLVGLYLLQFVKLNR
ncbi:MAG: hypothetical protein ACJAZA_000630 [Shewanella psychromarinicola]